MQKNLERSHQTKGLIRLTMACNERCSFCNVPVENYQRPTPPWEQIKQELELFIETGQQTLTISGGEPTLLRKRLIQLIREAKEGGIPFVELQTNAVLLRNKEYVKELVEAGLTSAFISLLSDRADLHDDLVELEGAFAHCIEGIQNLLEAGVWVTLNPVLTSKTADRLLEYIEFVHQIFPQIRTISLSAVQPHGRAEQNWHLLPDYQKLKELVPRAIELAHAYSIDLLNPYCGLPICIGWSKDRERCVETIDHNKTFRPNIQNKGNKSKGVACTWCAYRVGCGGAWHKYWEARAGSGIKAPYEIIPPWIEMVQNEYQTVIFGRFDENQNIALNTPSVWFVTYVLNRDILQNIFQASFTECVVFLEWNSPNEMKEEIRLLQRIQKRFRITEQRLHVLIDGRKISIQQQRLWDELCHRLGINCKIIEEFPVDFPKRAQHD